MTQGGVMIKVTRRAVSTAVTVTVAKPIFADHPGKIFDKILSNEERSFQAIDNPAARREPG